MTRFPDKSPDKTPGKALDNTPGRPRDEAAAWRAPPRRHAGCPAALTAALTAALLAACATPSPLPRAHAPAPAVPSPAPAPAAQSPVAVPSAPASAASSSPEASAEVQQRFARWVATFRDAARAAGIDEATLHATLDSVRLRRQAVELDRNQPEFTRPIWDYLEAVISPQRVTTGQQKLAQFRTEAEAATARYGVPPEVLAAVWGNESNFGVNYGDVPVFDALATLGFEGRREAWAKDELLAALKIVQRGDIEAARMIGSWAGAMGQTQFMPSSYLAFAVDADGDGRRDIWGSMADVLSSTAHFLARAGWQPQEPCSPEVRLPDGFDPAQADPTVRQDAAQWAAQGLVGIDGAPLPTMADASVLLPAGARGPAFLTGRNFRTVLRYNNSVSYALTVCLLAQRMAGGPGVQAPWPRDLRALSRGELRALQTGLNQLGFDSGTPDGQMGPATRRALRQFQQSQGLPADGYPTEALLRRLQPQP